jgi:hypothetical protein
MKTKFALIVIFILFGMSSRTSFAQSFIADFVDNTTIFDDA